MCGLLIHVRYRNIGNVPEGLRLSGDA